MVRMDASDPTQAVHAVLPDGDAVLEVELVGKDPVAQRGVIIVEVVQLVDQVGVVSVPLTDRVVEPLVVPLPGQAEDPQRHRDRWPPPAPRLWKLTLPRRCPGVLGCQGIALPPTGHGETGGTRPRRGCETHQRGNRSA